MEAAVTAEGTNRTGSGCFHRRGHRHGMECEARKDGGVASELQVRIGNDAARVQRMDSGADAHL